MNDKQIINSLINIVWNWAEDDAVAVATLVNNDIPVNVIAEYYGRSETAEYLQKAKNEGLID